MNTLTLPVNAGDHVQGLEDSPLTLVEYGDYECPYCGEAYPIVKRLQKKMGEDLRFVFRNFPLSEIHPHALAAAQAAEAAGLQNRFWEMHDGLFENQDRLEDENLIVLAGKLKLDIETFKHDLSSKEVTAKLEKDFSSGIRSGVNGTPTFYINGVRHDGSYEYEDLLASLQEQLEPTHAGWRPHDQSHKVHERKMSHANPKR